MKNLLSGEVQFSLALLLGMALAAPPDLLAQDYIVSPSAIQNDVAAASAARLRNRDQVRSLLSAVCDYAVEIGLISANPAEDPRHPVGSKKEIAGWTDAEAHRFLAAAFGHRLYPLYVLALATGMRMGELLALSWTDVDLEGCIITVSRTALSTGRATASRRGVRRIGIGPVAVRMLEGHRSRLASERGVLGEQESDLVFPSVAGTPIRHQNLVRISLAPS